MYYNETWTYLSVASIGVYPYTKDTWTQQSPWQPVQGKRELRVNVLNAAGLYLFKFWATYQVGGARTSFHTGANRHLVVNIEIFNSMVSTNLEKENFMKRASDGMAGP